MKFKTRLIIAFLTVIMIPVALTSLFVLLLGRYQISAIEKTYGLTGTTVEVLANPIQVLEKLTIEPYEELEETAKDVVRAEGETYGASAEVVTCYFPDKRYGDLLFPAGRYRALRITLGTGAGHNWWCVLYPSLCFTDPVCAVVDEEGKEELEEALTAEEYEMIMASTKFRIKWFFLGDSSDD